MPRRPAMAWGSVSKGCAGTVLSSEITAMGVPTSLDDREGNIGMHAMQVQVWLPGVRDLRHVQKFHPEGGRTSIIDS